MPVMTDEGAEAVQAGTETEPDITDGSWRTWIWEVVN